MPALESSEYVNDASQGTLTAGASSRLDTAALIGRWTNTNSAPVGIAEIWIKEEGGELVVRCFGARSPEPSDWGSKPAETYALAVTSDVAAGFELIYDFGHQEALVTAIHNRGVLVIHTYHRFREGNERSNFIVKEFFHQ